MLEGPWFQPGRDTGLGRWSTVPQMHTIENVPAAPINVILNWKPKF
jgi:hypothetical protein